MSFEEAVVEAQQLGFAESDVARDLSGQDTEDKLRILARIAFGAEHDGFFISREGLEAVRPRTLNDYEVAKTCEQVIRLVRPSSQRAGHG
jgi:homoserine dehydrogenase